MSSSIPLLFSFAGVAGCIPFQVGASKAFRILTAPEEVKAYAGVSSGSIVALLLALGYREDELATLFISFTKLFVHWYDYPLLTWFYRLREFWEKIIPPDAYLYLSSNLYIGYTAVTSNGLQPRIVSTYSSNEEVIKAVEVSCHIFPYRKWPLVKYKGEWCCDGAFTCHLLKPKGYRVIGISSPIVASQVFWSDWIPSLCTLSIGRLQDNGYCFVMREKDYFLQEEDRNRRLALPSYPSLIRITKRSVILFILFLIHRRYRC